MKKNALTQIRNLFLALPTDLLYNQVTFFSCTQNILIKKAKLIKKCLCIKLPEIYKPKYYIR